MSRQTINQQDVFNLLRKTQGEANLITIPKVFVDYTGDWTSAILLGQLLFWSDKGDDKDGWIFKTYKEWEKEIKIKENTLRKAANKLLKMGAIEKKIKKAYGNPTVHYRIKQDVFINALLEISKDRYLQVDSNDTVNSEETIKTETTTETTTDIYIPEKEKNSNNINEELINKALLNQPLDMLTKNINKELINKVLTVWNNQSHLTTHNLSTVTRKFQKKHIAAINDIGLDKVLKSIVNYGKIVGNPNMWYTYRFTLWDFIGRSLENFIDEAKPFENFKKVQPEFEEKEEFVDPYPHPGQSD